MTFQIPDSIFRQAKSMAAERGIPLSEFVTQAVKEKLAAQPRAGEKPWMAGFGKLKRFREETKRINTVIEAAFEQLETQRRK